MSASMLTNAGTMGDLNQFSRRFYLGLEGGDSISANSNLHASFDITGLSTITGSSDAAIFAVFSSLFTPQPLSSVGATGYGGVFAVYEWNSNVALQFDYSYRKGYSFKTAGFLYSTASKNIVIQTFLFDLYLKPSVNWGGFVPYIKGGIGASLNTIPGINGLLNIASDTNPMNLSLKYYGKTISSFIWDVGAGADYYFNQNISLGLNYRFVDAGGISSSNVATIAITNANVSITYNTTPISTHHVYLNELYATLAYHFDV